MKQHFDVVESARASYRSVEVPIAHLRNPYCFVGKKLLTNFSDCRTRDTRDTRCMP